MTVFSIPFGVPYLETAVAHLVHTIPESDLAHTTIITPSPAGTALLKSLLDKVTKSNLAVPLIVHLSDDYALTQWLESHQQRMAPSQQKPSQAQRLLCIYHYLKETNQAPQGSSKSLLEISVQLLDLMDEMTLYDIPFSALGTLVPQDHAQRWQQSLALLGKTFSYWQSYLHQHRLVDPIKANHALLKHITRYLETNNPSKPVIALGSTASRPTTAKLLQAIAKLPHGMVYLEGLTPAIGSQTLSEAHPCYHVQQFAKSTAMDIQVIEITSQNDPSTSALLEQFFAPAELFGQVTDTIHSALWNNIHVVECPHLQEEAAIIAQTAHHWLNEAPHEPIAIITNNYELEQYLVQSCKHLQIPLHSSCSLPLNRTALWQWMMLFLKTALQPFNLSSLMALLKHPLMPDTIEHPPSSLLARQLEVHFLRHKRFTFEDYESIGHALYQSSDNTLYNWLKPVLDGFVFLHDGFNAHQPKQTLGHFLRLHLASLTLNAEGRTWDDHALWHTEEGKKVASFLHEWLNGPLADQTMDTADYPEVLSQLARQQHIAAEPIPSPNTAISILTPFAARLADYKRVIIADCNEGSIPFARSHQPWLNNTMRKHVGLPDYQKQLGLESHDFCHLFAAQSILFTRSRKINGTVSVQSRWLQRLLTYASLCGVRERLTHFPLYDTYLAKQHHTTAPQPASPPEPRPPVSARPRSLTVRQIETWMRDPYSIYAENILNLKKLEPLKRDTLTRDFGMFIHRCLELLHQQPFDETSFTSILSACGEKALLEIAPPEPVIFFWRKKLTNLTPWVQQIELAWQRNEANTVCELPFQLDVPHENEQWTIRGRIDRLSYFPTGEAILVDYKTHGTGSLPKQREIKTGLSPQILIYALGLKQSPTYQHLDIAELAYWCLTGNRPPAEAYNFTEKKELKELASLLKEAEAGLKHLFAVFNSPHTPYLAIPNPANKPRFNDYAHLARHQSWE
ncbi:MAG: PD-(D/E)XK nuclease family protein [Alphaproteobacteria bacterium]|nr:PD-(D/E)XK nuclease family protein [Alphaproteobacteria bacterium]